MDKKDPICGMEGHIKAHGHYFCSEHCIKKYEKEHNIKVKEFCPSCLVHEKKPWYKEKLYTFIILTAALFAASYFFVPKLFDALLDYFHLIWWAVLLGLLIGGIIDFLVPSSYIQKYLSQHRKRTIIYSVAFGFLMSACSHGILAIAIELYKKGANTSSVVAFLLASPWANLPITVLLFGFFGVKALFIVLSAVIIAIITGLIFQVLERNAVASLSVIIIEGNSGEKFWERSWKINKNMAGIEVTENTVLNEVFKPSLNQALNEIIKLNY